MDQQINQRRNKKKCMDTNKKENTMVQNLLNSEKNVLKGKYIATWA